MLFYAVLSVRVKFKENGSNCKTYMTRFECRATKSFANPNNNIKMCSLSQSISANHHRLKDWSYSILSR